MAAAIDNNELRFMVLTGSQGILLRCNYAVTHITATIRITY